MVNTQQAQIQLDELKNSIIGIYKDNLGFRMVTDVNNNGTIDTIRFTEFGTIRKEFNAPLRAGKLAMFDDNKTMNQMLDNSFEWAGFMKQFES